MLKLLKYQVEPHEDAMQTKSCTLIVTFSLILLGMYVVESVDMNNNRQKRFTEVDICFETNNTLEFVNECPDSDFLFQERSIRKNCESYPQCTGEPLVYHCVRFREELVEVCAPRGLITGFCCALFDEGVGRVVEDYFHPCSDCPFVYQSDDGSKYSKCVGSIIETSTAGRYKKHTTIADRNNSIETSTVLTSQRSSFSGVYHHVMLYGTPATISFTVKEGKYIQHKGKLREGHFVSIAFATLLVVIICLSVFIGKRYRKHVSLCSSASKENWI